MDIRRLRYFCELARTGNFTQAATRLGIAQPALSMAIQKLESEVGLKLINRSERQMALTADGSVMFKHAEIILENIREAEKELQELKGMEVGMIQFGAPAMLSSYYLPDALVAFKQQYPGVRINLFEAGTATLEQMLLDGQLDLALVRTDRASDQIRTVDLPDQEIVACVPSNHPFSQQTAVHLDQFCQEPLVLFREGYFLREAISNHLNQKKSEQKKSEKKKPTLDIRFETNLIGLLKSLVISEVGIGTCLPMIIGEDEDLVTVPFSPSIPLYLGLGWKKNHYLSKASRVFLSFLQEQLQEQ